MNIVNARFFKVFGPEEVSGKYRNVIQNFMLRYPSMDILKELMTDFVALGKHSEIIRVL